MFVFFLLGYLECGRDMFIEYLFCMCLMIENWNQFICALIPCIPTSPRGMGPDQLRQRISINGKFEMHSYYEALKGSNRVVFPWRSVRVYNDHYV